jgi:hypothetical protein
MSTKTMDRLNSSVLCAQETRSTSQKRQGPDKREGRHKDFPPPKKASQALLLGDVRRDSVSYGCGACVCLYQLYCALGGVISMAQIAVGRMYIPARKFPVMSQASGVRNQ